MYSRIIIVNTCQRIYLNCVVGIFSTDLCFRLWVLDANVIFEFYVCIDNAIDRTGKLLGICRANVNVCLCVWTCGKRARLYLNVNVSIHISFGFALTILNTRKIHMNKMCDGVCVCAMCVPFYSNIKSKRLLLWQKKSGQKISQKMTVIVI